MAGGCANSWPARCTAFYLLELLQAVDAPRRVALPNWILVPRPPNPWLVRRRSLAAPPGLHGRRRLASSAHNQNARPREQIARGLRHSARAGFLPGSGVPRHLRQKALRPAQEPPAPPVLDLLLRGRPRRH